MPAFNKFNALVQTLANGGIALAADTIKIMLTNTPPSAANALYGDVSGTEVANGNGYTTGGQALTGVTSSQTSGTETVAASGTLTWTGSGGGMAPFRYIVAYDATATSPLKPLLGWWDYGSTLTLAAGQTFVFGVPSGLLQLS
jgi:hypothetical protein